MSCGFFLRIASRKKLTNLAAPVRRTNQLKGFNKEFAEMVNTSFYHCIFLEKCITMASVRNKPTLPSNSE